MKRSVRLLFISIAVLALNVAMLPNLTVTAHADDSDSDQPQNSETSKPVTENAVYEFVTPNGCSLSLLTRRALQIYDQQKDDISLNPAAAMYAETNIVQRLGSRLLEVNERVSIERSILEEYVNRSKELSTAQLAAWQDYADQADFNLSYINTVATSSAQTERPNDEDSKEQQSDKDKAAQIDTYKRSAESPRVSVFWWLLAAASIGVIYYLLGQQRVTKKRK